jgi:hypothetical protein
MKIIKNLEFTVLAALAALLVFQPPTIQAGDHGKPVAPSNPFVTLLEGIYGPVAQDDIPDLGFPQFVENGSEAKISIYNVDSGVPDPTDKAVGTFYVQFVGDLCAYDFPKGKILAEFTFVDDVGSYTYYPDPVLRPSWIFVGTEELNILEATGIYQSFAGGHIHMVDRLEYRADDGTFLEHCFCHYSREHGKP